MCEISAKKIYVMKCFIGACYGLSFPLTIVILDYWLKSIGVSNTTIGLFSLLQWPFALKFVWGFLIDRYDIPYFSKIFGRERSWLVVSYIFLLIGIFGMAFSEPHLGLSKMIFFASIVSLADGCKNVVMYPYQIDRCEKQDFGYIASIVGLGHRAGMLFTKIATLYIADMYNWRVAYMFSGVMVLLSFIVVLCINAPENPKCTVEHIRDNILKSKEVIGILILYKAADFMTQKMSRALCIHLGFSPTEIANIVQVCGTTSVVLGTFIGGYCIKKFALYRAMFVIEACHAAMLFWYAVLAYVGNSLPLLGVVSFFDGVTGGAATAAFIAFLYNVSRNGTAYSFCWAIHGASTIFFMTMSGFIADILPWTTYFACAPFTAVPVLLLLYKKQWENDING